MRHGLILVCLLTASLAGCSSEKKTDSTKPAASAATINHMCPIQGDEFGSAPGDTRTWKGATVGFCCDHCAAKFDKMTDTEKDNVMNMAKSNKAMGH